MKTINLFGEIVDIPQYPEMVHNPAAYINSIFDDYDAGIDMSECKMPWYADFDSISELIEYLDDLSNFWSNLFYKSFAQSFRELPEKLQDSFNRLVVSEFSFFA